MLFRSQQILQARLLCAALGLASDEPVECFEPANDAEDEFDGESAIGGGKSCVRERAIKQCLGVFVAELALAQDASRYFSWFLAVHFV